MFCTDREHEKQGRALRYLCEARGTRSAAQGGAHCRARDLMHAVPAGRELASVEARRYATPPLSRDESSRERRTQGSPSSDLPCSGDGRRGREHQGEGDACRGSHVGDRRPRGSWSWPRRSRHHTRPPRRRRTVWRGVSSAHQPHRNRRSGMMRYSQALRGRRATESHGGRRGVLARGEKERERESERERKRGRERKSGRDRKGFHFRCAAAAVGSGGRWSRCGGRRGMAGNRRVLAPLLPRARPAAAQVRGAASCRLRFAVHAGWRGGAEECVCWVVGRRVRLSVAVGG